MQKINNSSTQQKDQINSEEEAEKENKHLLIIMPTNVQSIIQLCSFHVSKVMLKILQVRSQQYVNRELPGAQAGFQRGRGTISNCQCSRDHTENKGIPE